MGGGAKWCQTCFSDEANWTSLGFSRKLGLVFNIDLSVNLEFADFSKCCKRYKKHVYF